MDKTNISRTLLVGTICEKPELTTIVPYDTQYLFYVSIKGIGNKHDIIPVIVSEKNLRNLVLKSGYRLGIIGNIRSADLDHGEMWVYVNAQRLFTIKDNLADQNILGFSGYLCNSPSVKKIPDGRTIADFKVVHHSYPDHSSYLPCICWDDPTKKIPEFNKGIPLYCIGRIQSRILLTKENEDIECKSAYKISLIHIAKKYSNPFMDIYNNMYNISFISEFNNSEANNPPYF